MKKIIFYLLLLLNLLLPLCIMSNTIDGDFGWHLRFGQELHSGQPFPHLDTYTYTFYGKPWTNHEWGSDYLIWFIYDRLGYWWLNILFSLSIFFSFILIGKTFYKKITSVYLVVALFCEYFTEHIFVARPTMFAPLFFAITVYFLEKSKKDFRWLFILPPIIWLWSTLHGSWILGFIVLNIYLFCDIFTRLVPAKFKKYINEDTADKKWITVMITTQIFGAILVAINPYCLGIYKEIYEYFGQGYYKQYIGEWIPSYTFQIFWGISVVQTVALVFIIYGFIKKKVGFTQLTLFVALFYAAFMYKRQAIFMGILSVPVLVCTIDEIVPEFAKLDFFKQKFNKKIFLSFLTLPLIYLTINYVIYSHYTRDCWNDRDLIEGTNFSFDSIIWLKNNAELNSKIFSEFSWAAMLNWQARQAYMYIDGRGTATWMYSDKISMLEHYYAILESVDGLKELESLGTNYIILRQPKFAPFAKPDFLNDALFGERVKTNSMFQPVQLEKSLNNSSNWQKVFSDRRANIWKRVNPAP